MERQIKIIVAILAVNFAIVPAVSGYYAYYLPETHSLIIHENGILNDTTWGVSLVHYVNGSKVPAGNYSTSSQTMRINLPYGYFAYSLLVPRGYMGSSSENSFFLTSSGVMPDQTAVFHKLYPLSFAETGLNQSYNWTVHVDGRLMSNSTTIGGSISSVTLMIPRGTYSYSASASSLIPGAAATYPVLPSTVTKNGVSYLDMPEHAYGVNVSFTKTTRAITFSLATRGIISTPGSTSVPVHFDGRTGYLKYNATSGLYDSLTFYVPRGVYLYSSVNLTGYTEENQWGEFRVLGSNVSIAMVFKPNNGL